MIVGIPNAGQVDALATLSIRGERSVTRRGDFDLHRSKGPCRRRPADLRTLPHFAGCTGAGGGSRRAIWPQSGFRKDAAIRCCLSLRTHSTRATCALLAAAMLLRYRLPARDDLLMKQLRMKGASPLPKLSALKTTGGQVTQAVTTSPIKSCPPRSATTQHLGWQSANPYDTTRAASGSSSGSAV